MKKRLAHSPAVWCFTTYFAEGFPYAIIRMISSFFFRDMQVSLQAIGLTSFFGLPWIVKFLWGPHVDQFGTKRQWMLLTQAAIAVLVVLAGVLAPLEWGVRAVAVVFLVGAFVAATHDIAIDGYYMEALDKEGQAAFVGYRVMAYRIAMMTGTGVVATIGATAGWSWAFLAAGLLLVGLFFFHLYFLPRCETPGIPLGRLVGSLKRIRVLAGASCLAAAVLGLRFLLDSPLYQRLSDTVPVLHKLSFSAWAGIGLLVALVVIALLRNRIRKAVLGDPDGFYAAAFISFMDRPQIGVILAFIILMRTGEFLLTAMNSPFIVDLGIKAHYGWITGGVGLPFSIVGAMAGGWMISRVGLGKVLWPFLLLQNLTNIVYMFLAFHLGQFVVVNTGNPDPLPLGPANLALIAGVHGFDQFAGGLGTSVLMTFLMRICKSAHKAAHYAIGTGLMSLSGLFTGVASGFLASWLGYAWFFGVSFAVSIPGMVLAACVPVVFSGREE